MFTSDSFIINFSFILGIVMQGWQTFSLKITLKYILLVILRNNNLHKLDAKTIRGIFIIIVSVMKTKQRH